jgi:hypothetical protein
VPGATEISDYSQYTERVRREEQERKARLAAQEARERQERQEREALEKARQAAQRKEEKQANKFGKTQFAAELKQWCKEAKIKVTYAQKCQSFKDALVHWSSPPHDRKALLERIRAEAVVVEHEQKRIAAEAALQQAQLAITGVPPEPMPQMAPALLPQMAVQQPAVKLGDDQVETSNPVEWKGEVKKE